MVRMRQHLSERHTRPRRKQINHRRSRRRGDCRGAPRGPRAAEFAAAGLVGAVLRDIAAGLRCGCDQHHHEDAPIMVQVIADGGGVQQI